MESNTALAPARAWATEPARDCAPRDAADLIVDALAALGVEYVFGVPGGAVEPLYNALARSARRGGPQAIVARNEQGAAYMADGYARETGRLGVCIATSGPGATNLITGVACAYDNNVPILVITGQPPIKNFGKGALQESSCTGINTVAMFRPCTRYNSLVSHAEQLPTKLFNALMQAQRAPSGPSHLSIPVDILREPLRPGMEAPDFAGLLRRAPALVDLPAVRQLARLLFSARQPVWLIGDGCGDAANELMQLVQRSDGSFITTPDGKGFINPRHPRYRGVFGFGGHASAAELLQAEPDLVIALGTGFGEFNSGGWSSTLLNSRLVHVDDSDENLMRSPMARLHVRGHIKSVCEQLLALLAPSHNGQEAQLLPFLHPQVARLAYEAMVDSPEALRSDSAPVKPQRLVACLSERCPPQTRFVADAGNSAAWAVHYLAPRDQRSARLPGSAFLPAGQERRTGSSSWLRVTMDFAPMGWAIGSAVGIAMANRRCPVVCLTGDGSYLMNGQEITVAAELGLPVLYVVLNDGALGMVKHGQRLAGAEPIGFQLPKVDFAAMAASMGIPGHVIRTPQELDALDFDALLSRAGPTLLDVRIDGEEVPPMNLRMRTLGTAR
ncbi:thiamine pyrophosphate-binding protein [Roseateles saccharophilus]|uniref:Acetolactate synthase-1/2/3 large subunit n=1 Tax=Roseateles saccharophilus TaxID=304 RepID=A0A4R3VEE1_ROSSA|nr:thiamine pyrophosphate-binding protein [Roseateles saccharophilus]TCV03757.1 acetolactate synthase-1/2/3 large subunit [Roseateles saccharophilus]